MSFNTSNVIFIETMLLVRNICFLFCFFVIDNNYGLETDETPIRKEKSIHETDVIQLNIGGEILATTRQTLTSHPKSLFAILFNGRWEHQLHVDGDGNIFFDFNPIVFRHLLDQLQSSNRKSISPPSDPSLVQPFEKMLKKLGLSTFHKTISTVNVNGQIITTQKSTLNNIMIISFNQSKLSNSQSDIFIDNHPKLFRRFIQFRREKLLLNITCRNISFAVFKQLFLSPLFNNTMISCGKYFGRYQLKSNLKWKQNAKTIAGGNGEGNSLNQLHWPHGIYVDYHQQVIYIADWANHRIMKWKLGENSSEIVAGGYGQGNRIDQLKTPTDVIVDHSTKSLIICDNGNARVLRYSLENRRDIQILIPNIYCYRLMMNENGDLFVSNWLFHRVEKWKKGANEEIIVAGGNGRGDRLNQLYNPSYIFIDREETVYVSDSQNHRVMKWLKGAKEGIIVAGGHGSGNSSKQLNYPEGLIVNEVGDILTADSWNGRIVCWPLGSKEGRVVAGGNGAGEESNQFKGPTSLSFDNKNNLYVSDYNNNRIQRFNVDKN